jgi:hypothetical protein
MTTRKRPYTAKLKKYNAQWRKNNPGYARTWYLDHKEEVNERAKAWRLANPEKVRAYNVKHAHLRKLKRQAEKKNAHG